MPHHGFGTAVVAGAIRAEDRCHEKLFDLNAVEAHGPAAVTRRGADG
jgi:hypothetical protein